MRPGPRTLSLLGTATLAAFLLPLHPAFGVLALTAILIAAAGVFLEGSWLRGALVVGEREESQTLAQGSAGHLALRVRNNGPRPLKGRVRQVLPDTVAESAAEEGLALRPGEETVLRFGISARRRGSRPLASPFVRFTIHDFVEKTMEMPCPGGELRVVPDVGNVRRAFEELRRFALKGFGARVGVSLGKGREFDRLRDYVPGDDLRDISWKITARRSRLTVREYRLDRSQDIVMCVDTGLRMNSRVGSLSRLDHATRALVLLGYACQRMEDNVAALSFSARAVMGVPLGRGSGMLNRLLKFATEVKGAPLPSDYLALAADLRARLKHRALIVILTTLPEDDSATLLRAVRLLTPAHLPLVVALTDVSLKAVADSEARDADQLFRTLAARDLIRHRQNTIRQLRSLGARLVETAPGTVGIATMNAYLAVKRRQLL